MITFVTAPGIGDAIWSFAKIYHMFSQRKVGIKVCDYDPPRTKPLIDLLPVENLGYTPWRFPDGHLPTYTDLDSLPDGEYRIQCNLDLDRGIRLENIFPKQPTNYHIPLLTTDEHKSIAELFINQIEGSPRIGIYASFHNNYCPWDVHEWVRFCSLIREQYPNAAFYVIGAPWDDRTMDIYTELKDRAYNVISQVGIHHIGSTIEVLKQLDYFFAFPSGLGILCDVIDTPCMMWFYQSIPQPLMNMYADPINVASGRHLNVPEISIEQSFDMFMKRGSQFIKEK